MWLIDRFTLFFTHLTNKWSGNSCHNERGRIILQDQWEMLGRGDHLMWNQPSVHTVLLFQTTILWHGRKAVLIPQSCSAGPNRLRNRYHIWLASRQDASPTGSFSILIAIYTNIPLSQWNWIRFKELSSHGRHGGSHWSRTRTQPHTTITSSPSFPQWPLTWAAASAALQAELLHSVMHSTEHPNIVLRSADWL